jgi:signal transduction histidine kinase
MPTRVLLVDDEDHIRSVLCDSLASSGYDVDAAASGEDGLSRLSEKPADLMIVDLKMPGISGLEFAAQAAEIVPDGQIVILTGYGDMKSAIEAMRSGAYDYLTKPVDLDRLLQTLRKADERRKLILENRDLLRRLTEANRIKAEFINGMSHEVRTPLGHITGFAQILQDTVENLTEKQTRYIENIQNGASRLLDLFDKIMSFSTLKSGDVQVKPEPGNVSGLLQTAIDAARSEAADLGVTLRVNSDCSEDVLVDRKICERVLSLLVDNAIKFNEENGDVTLSGEILPGLPQDVDVPNPGASEKWLALTVADTGIGVPEDQLEHIFGLFTQADASLARPYEGAGIGLALGRSLALLHGGTITVSSDLGKGSRFTLLLPLGDPADA